jgi:sugar fermentation stimulation protein A
MHFRNPLVPGRLIRRYKRFLAEIELDSGGVVTAHCPNSGTMMTCSDPGSRVLVSRAEGRHRKLAWTWELIHTGPGWCMVNTRWPNIAVGEALRAGGIPELGDYGHVAAEVACGDSRLDFVLSGPSGKRCWVEVKNCTLLWDDGRIRFPDAVTTRGQKHLRTLIGQIRVGDDAAMLYFVGRAEGTVWSPADAIDPEYGALVRAAAAAGVGILAYRAQARPDGVELGDPVPVAL